MRRLGVALLFAMLPACATFPGVGGKTAEVEPVAVNEEAQIQIAALEAEVAKLKSQNARLANQVLSLQRERDSQAAANEAKDGEGTGPELPPAPEVIAQEPSPKPNAVVDDAASPGLAKTGVPVQPSPRLVQPEFASNETVFENEAEGELATKSVLFGVHLASYRHEAEARAGWRQLQRDNPDELGLLEPRVEPVSVEGKGEFLRLVGGGFSSRDKAEALCGKLKAKKLFCAVTGFEGQRLSLAETTTH